MTLNQMSVQSSLIGLRLENPCINFIIFRKASILVTKIVPAHLGDTPLRSQAKNQLFWLMLLIHVDLSLKIGLIHL